MEQQYYSEFLRLNELGLRRDAKVALAKFLNSFANLSERETWTWEYLASIKSEEHPRIRHEIFEQIVYPVLKAGLDVGNVDSILWLGRLIQNVYGNAEIHAAIGWVSAYTLFKQAYTIAPANPEVSRLLLGAIIRGLEYCVHEWPAGILSGKDGATLEECQQIRQDIELAMHLDTSMVHRSFLAEVSRMVSLYEERLFKREKARFHL